MLSTNVSIEQKTDFPEFEKAGVQVYVKRDDKIHPYISGNKWRKLKYNYQSYLQSGKSGIVTFGGAFSNHIIATAAFCAENKIPCVGIIRGEEPQGVNHVLILAKLWGMDLHFVSRDAYRDKSELSDLWQEKGYFVIPEGGENDLGIKGCEEILKNIEPKKYDKICCAVGTATTMIGMLKSTETDVIGFAALKNAGYMIEKIKQQSGREQIELIDDIYFGGFGKWNNELIHFIEEMELNHNLKLDKVYTAKLFYNVIKKTETAIEEKWQIIVKDNFSSTKKE